jgi:hypothetical protein
MHLETIAAPTVEQPIVELSTKLQQLRRLKTQPQAQPSSRHLTSALQAARQEPAGMKADVSYIFIGIILPSPPGLN